MPRPNLKKLPAIGIAIAGALLTNSADDVKANLAAWLALVGIYVPSDWPPSYVLAGIGILVVLAGVVWAIWPTRDRWLLIETQAGPMIMLAPAEGPRRIALLHRVSEQSPGGGLANFTPLPEVKPDWLKDIYGCRCEVINYASEALVDVDFHVAVIFREALRDGNTMRRGVVVQATRWPIHIDHLGPGRENRFTFFIENTERDHFALVAMSSKGVAKLFNKPRSFSVDVKATPPNPPELLPRDRP